MLNKNLPQRFSGRPRLTKTNLDAPMDPLKLSKVNLLSSLDIQIGLCFASPVCKLLALKLYILNILTYTHARRNLHK